MKVFITKDLIFGLQITFKTVYAWVNEGMPVIRQNPYHFGQKSIDWILINKPKYKAQVEKMLEGEDAKNN